MSVPISGILLDPYGNVARFADIKFVTVQGAFDVIESSSAVFRTDENGAYSIDVQFGRFAVLMRFNGNNGAYDKIQTISVNSDTIATTLGELLEYTEPLTPGEILIVQQLVQQATDAKDDAEAAALAALLSEQNAAASAAAALASENAAANSVALLAPVPLNGGVWAAGQEFTAYNQYMIFNGEAYSPRQETVLPYVVGATPDLGFVYQIKLNSLQALSGLTEPSDLDQVHTRTFTSVTSMLASSGLVSGRKYSTGITTWEYLGGDSSDLLNFKVVGHLFANDFGEIQGGVDCTAIIQPALNYASKVNIHDVYLTHGKYDVTTLYMTYDAILNPGFSQTFIGRMRLVGAGAMVEVDALNYNSVSIKHGTVLNGIGTGSTVVMATPAQGTFASTYPVRGSQLALITIANNSANYCIENNGGPEQSMLNGVTCIQRNNTGNGILWNSSWYSKLENVLCTTVAGNPSTGSAFATGSTVFAGLYELQSCYFKRFANGTRLASTLGSSEYVFRSCSFEGCSNVGFLVENATKNIKLDSCYFEANGVHHIKVDTPATNFVSGLVIDNCFLYGGLSAEEAVSGACIYIKSANTCKIVSVHFMRPWTTLVYNHYDSTAVVGNNTTVENCSVDFSGVVYGGATINCIDTNIQAGMPLLINNNLPDNAVFTPVNPAFVNSTNIDGRSVGFSAPRFTDVFTYSTSGPNETDNIDINQSTYRLYTVTSSGFGIKPPSNANGRMYYIGNNVGSTQPIVLFRVGAGALTTLAPGEGAVMVSNPLTNEFVAFKTSFIE